MATPVTSPSTSTNNTHAPARPRRPQAAAKTPSKGPAPSAAPSATRAKGKPTQWRRWGEQVVRFSELVTQLQRVVKAPVDAKYAGNMRHLGEALPGDETGRDLVMLVSSLQQLDAERVPVPAIPKPAKFSVGDHAYIPKNFWGKKLRAKLLASGFYTDDMLDDMVVMELSEDGVQAMCETGDGGRQVLVRFVNQLEAVR